MREPVVSILLPVRDGADTLPRLLASIAAQTLTDWELVAVDDGSRDGTAGLLAAAALRDGRIRVLPSNRAGLVPALETGRAAARARLVARVDADDEMHPERLQRQVDALRSDPGLGLVASRVTYRTDGGEGRGLRLWVAWNNGLLTHEQMALARFVESPLVHPSVCFRREAAERHGGYREGDFPEDYEWQLRWFEAGVRMRKLPQELLVWHDRPGRLTRVDPRYATDAFYRVKTPYLARWLERHNPHHPRVTVWGAGRTSRRHAALLEARGVYIERYVDVSPAWIGRRIGGRLVEAPEALPPPGERFVLSYVGARTARGQITAFLRARGYVLGRDALCAA